MSHIPDKRKPSDTMSAPPKRSRVSYADDDDESAAPSSTTTSHERPRNHPVYGQKSAFPGLDIEVEDELFYGPAENGMEYLRMVRSEANSLPLLFTAPKVSQSTTQVVEGTKDDDGDNGIREEESTPRKDSKRTYLDGVYVAPPLRTTAETTAQTPNTPSAETPYPDAQLNYYNLLHHRFLLLRSIMKCTPPPSAIAALDDSHPISLPRHSKVACKEWRRLVLAVDPQMVQLACMDMDSVLGVLGIMARLMSENVRSGDAERVRRIGAWAWGLLGKCREVGQLGTEEVGGIRDLGKRAVKILYKMREDESRSRVAAAQDESDDDDPDDEQPAEDINGDTDDGGNKAHANDHADTAEAADQDMPDAVATEHVPDELEAAKARLQAKIQSEDKQLQSGTEESEESPDYGDLIVQTRAMLGMIITVVGEYYGQRDLLKEREVWHTD